MKIIVISQPYPMGNGCGLNQAIVTHFSNPENEVYFVEQLNGNEAGIDYFAEQLNSVQPDLLYFEMLDKATFSAIEKVNCKKILVYASKGILSNFDDIIEYNGKWFDAIYTNSRIMNQRFLDKGLLSDHFKYYHCWLTDFDLGFDEKYSHDCTFLGMGFNRLQSEDYKLERDLFFLQNFPFDFKIYGNGWPRELPWYAGLLPADDMGKLYSSVNSAMAIIAPSQRSMGMINNRFVEIGFCDTPIITYPYKEVDWFGADKFLNFVDNKEEIMDVVEKCVHMDSLVVEKAADMKIFVEKMTQEFYQGLDDLVGKL